MMNQSLLRTFQNPTQGIDISTYQQPTAARTTQPSQSQPVNQPTGYTTNLNGQSIQYTAQPGQTQQQAFNATPSAVDAARAALGLSTSTTPKPSASPTVNPVGYLNAANTTGVSVSPNNAAAASSNINLARPNTAMNLQQIIAEQDPQKRQQLLEAYYNSSLQASGVNNINVPGINPFNQGPKTLADAIKMNLPSFTNPITGQRTQLSAFSNPVAGYVNAPGGSPIGVGINALYGLSDHGQYMGGGIPGFNPNLTNLGPFGMFANSLQGNPFTQMMGAGLKPSFNFDVGGNATFDPSNTFSNFLRPGGGGFNGMPSAPNMQGNFNNLLNTINPDVLQLLMSIGVLPNLFSGGGF